MTEPHNQPDLSRWTAAFDAAWTSIMEAPDLVRARKQLSIHELRTLIAHVGKAFVEHPPSAPAG